MDYPEYIYQIEENEKESKDLRSQKKSNDHDDDELWELVRRLITKVEHDETLIEANSLDIRKLVLEDSTLHKLIIANSNLIKENTKYINKNAVGIDNNARDITDNYVNIKANTISIKENRKLIDIAMSRIESLADDAFLKDLWIAGMGEIGYSFDQITKGRKLYAEVLAFQKTMHQWSEKLKFVSKYGSVLDQTSMISARELASLLGYDYLPDGVYCVYTSNIDINEGKHSIINTDSGFIVDGVTVTAYVYNGFKCPWVFFEKKDQMCYVLDYINNLRLKVDDDILTLVLDNLVFFETPSYQHYIIIKMVLSYLSIAAIQMYQSYLDFDKAASGETAMYMISNMLYKTPISKTLTFQKMEVSDSYEVNGTFVGLGVGEARKSFLTSTDLIPAMAELHNYHKTEDVDFNGKRFTTIHTWTAQTYIRSQASLVLPSNLTDAPSIDPYILKYVSEPKDFSISADIDGESISVSARLVRKIKCTAIKFLGKAVTVPRSYNMLVEESRHGDFPEKWKSIADLLIFSDDPEKCDKLVLHGMGEYQLLTNLPAMGVGAEKLTIITGGQTISLKPIIHNGALAFESDEAEMSMTLTMGEMGGVFKTSDFLTLNKKSQFRWRSLWDIKVTSMEHQYKRKYFDSQEMIDEGVDNPCLLHAAVVGTNPHFGNGSSDADICNAYFSWKDQNDLGIDVEVYRRKEMKLGKYFRKFVSPYEYSAYTRESDKQLENESYIFSRSGRSLESNESMEVGMRWVDDYGWSGIHSFDPPLSSSDSKAVIGGYTGMFLSPPHGILSPNDLSKDLISLSDDVERLKRYISDMYKMIMSVEARLAFLDEWVEVLLRDVEHKSTYLGHMAMLVSFVSGAVGMFMPLVGIAGEVLGTVLQGIDSINQREYTDGITDFVVASLMTVYGVRKLLSGRKKRFLKPNSTYSDKRMGKHNGTVLHEDPSTENIKRDFSKRRKVLTVDTSSGKPKLSKLDFDPELNGWRFTVGPELKSWKVLSNKGINIQMTELDIKKMDQKEWIYNFISEYYSVYRTRTRSVIPQPLLTSIVTTLPYGHSEKVKPWISSDTSKWIDHLNENTDALQLIEQITEMYI